MFHSIVERIIILGNCCVDKLFKLHNAQGESSNGEIYWSECLRFYVLIIVHSKTGKIFIVKGDIIFYSIN